MENIKIKCAGCGESTFIGEWNEANVRIVKGKRAFAGGCPVCLGEFYEDDENLYSINETLSNLRAVGSSINNLTDDLIDELDNFLGSRELCSDLRLYLMSLEKPVEKILYRGMNYPTNLLAVGKVVEEWHGSTHWSKKIKIAKRFAFDPYINDDLLKELSQDEYLLRENNVSCASELFKPIVLRLKESKKAIDIHKITKKYKKLEKWRKEKEVTFIGSDFMIESIEYVESDKPYYLVDVTEC